MRAVTIFTIFMILGLFGCSDDTTIVKVEPHPLDGYVLCPDGDSLKWVLPEDCLFPYGPKFCNHGKGHNKDCQIVIDSLEAELEECNN